MKNEKIVTEDEETVLLNDITIIDDDNDPEKVTEAKPDRICNTTSVGDKVVGQGIDILKSRKMK